MTRNKDKLVLSKENRHRHNPMRSVLVYISFEFGYKSSSFSYSVILSILQSLSPRVFFLFYTIFFFHLHPPRVDQVTGDDPYPINTFLKSLGVAETLKITV